MCDERCWLAPKEFFFHCTSCVQIVPLMALRRYNWTAATRSLGDRLYFASQDVTGRPVHSSPRILAPSRSLTQAFSAAPSLRAAQFLMQRLAKLAYLSGRVPVWPTVNCSSQFIGKGFPIADLEGSRFERTSGWIPFWSKRCGTLRRPLLMSPTDVAS